MPGTTVIRRAWLERVGAFRPEYSHAEDWDLYLRLAAAGCPMTWVRQSVCQYRDHEGSSTRALDDHLRGIESVLADLSASPGCPLDLRPQMPRALARAYADSARAAVQRGEDDHARRALRLARETGAFTTWLRERLSASPEGFEALLEPIAAGQASRLIAAEDLSRAAGRWGVTPRELRRALARVEMKAFFASLTTGDRAETKSHLLAGLRRDPRWLVNRGVVGFLFGRPPREG
jgi:hypothetical protein